MRKVWMIVGLALMGAGLNAMAEDAGAAPKRERGPGGPDGPRPRMPLIAALDANTDGVIDADEIANAPASLKKLDKNGDGKLTREELMPPRPEGAPAPGEGRGPRPEGGRAPKHGEKPAEK